jgi:hypothetical protein
LPRRQDKIGIDKGDHMQTESARMSSASEAKFRIGGPNSLQRTIKIIALDPNSEKVLAKIGAEKWEGASFLTATAFSGSPAKRGDFLLQGWLSDLAGRARDLVNEVQSADSVIMVSTAGESAEAAELIGEACSLKHVLSTALILGAGRAPTRRFQNRCRSCGPTWRCSSSPAKTNISGTCWRHCAPRRSSLSSHSRAAGLRIPALRITAR